MANILSKQVSSLWLCGFLIFLMVISLSQPIRAQGDTISLDSLKLHKKTVVQKLIIPASLLAYGITSVYVPKLRQFDRYVNNSTIGAAGYSGSVDDYLRYGPVVAVYGLDLLGVSARHNFADRTAILLLSTMLTSLVVTATKKHVARERPDQSSFTFFHHLIRRWLLCRLSLCVKNIKVDPFGYLLWGTQPQQQRECFAYIIMYTGLVM